MFGFFFLVTAAAVGLAHGRAIHPLADVPGTLQLLSEDYTLMDITAHDGIVLKSLYFDPAPTESSGNPTIIFISSWGLNRWEYIVPAREYADKGYTVISYTARGFWTSGGVIDMAGPNDMADLSTVIDWAIANTNADPNRIGLSGISYGGGISLLGTARDSRVKSVSAMSCWVDMAESFLGNGETIRKEAVRFLQVLAEITGKPSEDLETVFDDYFHNKNLDFLYQFTFNSSAVNFIDEINANGAAIFIANALGDSLFTPNQFPDFFNALKAPKHLEFAPGDHAGPELPGIFGMPNQVWTRAGEWNDYYLKNNNNDVDIDMPQVIFNTMNGDEIETYSSWEEVTNSYLNFDLSSKETLKISKANKELSDVLLSSISSGSTANISGGVAYISSTIQAYVDKQKAFDMDYIIRERGSVFVSDRLQQAYLFRGEPELELTFNPNSSNGTLVIYLVSVDQRNQGHLFSFAPWTYKNLISGQNNNLKVTMTMTAYDMPAGHRMGMVLATYDMLYLDQSPENTKIDFLSGSTLRMPLHA